MILKVFTTVFVYLLIVHTSIGQIQHHELNMAIKKNDCDKLINTKPIDISNIENESLKVKVIYATANCLDDKGDVPALQKWIKKYLNALESDQKLYYKCLNMLGRSYNTVGKYDTAVMFLQKANYINHSNNFNYSDAYVNIRIAYEALGRYPDAFEAADQALKIDRINKDTAFIIESLISLGSAFSKLNESEQAEKCYQDALVLIQSTKYKDQITLAWTGLATLEYNKKNYSKYLLYCKKIFIQDSIKKNLFMLPHAAQNLAIAYSLTHDIKKSLSYYSTALEMFQSQNNMFMVTLNQYNVGSSYYLIEDYINAAIYSQYALESAKKNGFLSVAENSSALLSKIYQKLGKYKVSLDFLRQNIIYKDSIYNIEKLKISQELTKKYQLTEKSNEILEQKLKTEIAENKNKTYIIYLICLFIFIISIISFFRINQLKYKKTQNQQLVSLYDQISNINDSMGKKDLTVSATRDFKGVSSRLEKLSHNIQNKLYDLKTDNYSLAHEIKHQLKNAELTLENTIRDSKKEERPQLLHAQKILIHINDLLSRFLHSADLMTIPLVKTNVDIYELVSEISAEIENEFKVQIQNQVNPKSLIFTDRMILYQIIFNIMHNAAKFSTNKQGQNGCIAVHFISSHNIKTIHIKDNGPGIETQYRDHLLSKIIHKNRTSESHGLGLFTAQRLSERLGAKINLRHTDHLGTEFEICFEQNNI